MRAEKFRRQLAGFKVLAQACAAPVELIAAEIEQQAHHSGVRLDMPLATHGEIVAACNSLGERHG